MAVVNTNISSSVAQNALMKNDRWTWPSSCPQVAKLTQPQTMQ